MMQSGVVWMYFMLVHIMCTVMYKICSDTNENPVMRLKVHVLVTTEC